MTLPVWFGGTSDTTGDGARHSASAAARRLHLVRGDDTSPAVSTNPAHLAALFAQARAGDFIAFERLFEVYYPSLLRFARRFVPSRDDAEDVVQHVFTSLWLHRATISADAPPAPYLFGAVRNRALTHRKRFVRPQVTAAPSREAHDPSAAQTTAVTELRATLDGAIVALPERQRAALLLWWVEELNYADVGRALGVSAVAARKLVVKALERLRPLLDPS